MIKRGLKTKNNIMSEESLVDEIQDEMTTQVADTLKWSPNPPVSSCWQRWNWEHILCILKRVSRMRSIRI